MNTRSILVLVLLLIWGWITWDWWQSNKSQCCPAATPATTTPSTPGTATASLPLSFEWGKTEALPGEGYSDYIRSKIGQHLPTDTFVIRTWYYEGEANGEQLALQRGEGIKQLLKDSIPLSLIKVVTEKRALSNPDYQSQRFAAADFSWLHSSTAPPPLVEESDLKVIVRFATNSTAKQLEPEIDAALTRVAEKLKANPALKVNVVGHTDNVGDDARNMALSQQRADFVKTKLVEKGAAATSISTGAQGETQPVADNAIEGGRKLNRRVEINFQ
jgi:outer membrane protein OmpA-like peptidoglycan-associated protein